MWPQVGQAVSRKSKYSWARALTSSATTDLRAVSAAGRDVGVDATRRPGLASCPQARPGGPGAPIAYPPGVARTRIPDDVLTLAHERSAARAAKNWAEADRIRGEIEAAGWKVVDRGTDFALEPAHPPTLEDEGAVRYGSSDAVPSRLGEPDAGPATIVLVATDWPDDLSRALDGARAHA